MKYKIKKDSLVRIITPKRFIRCGYPLTLQNERIRITNQFGTQISQLFTAITHNKQNTQTTYHEPAVNYHRINNNAYNKMINAIAYASLVARGFGGTERSIHTTTDQEIKDMICRVLSVRYVITGIYQHGSSSLYEEDYEPPGLINQKRHKIIRVITTKNNINNRDFEIEECNVVNLMPDID